MIWNTIEGIKLVKILLKIKKMKIFKKKIIMKMKMILNKN